MRQYIPYYGTLIMLFGFIVIIVLINGGVGALVKFVLLPTFILLLYLIVKYFSALWADILLSIVFISFVQYLSHTWLYTIILFIGCLLIILAEHVLNSKKTLVIIIVVLFIIFMTLII